MSTVWSTSWHIEAFSKVKIFAKFPVFDAQMLLHHPQIPITMDICKQCKFAMEPMLTRCPWTSGTELVFDDCTQS